MEDFKDKYTTAEKVAADKTETEKNKVVVSNDTYAMSEQIFELNKRLEALRIAFKK